MLVFGWVMDGDLVVWLEYGYFLVCFWWMYLFVVVLVLKFVYVG